MDAITPSGQFDSKTFIKNLTQRPGIYKMLDARGEIIYIGKAKNLKNRVASYFRSKGAAPKQQALVSRIAAIEVTVTHTEGEALMLESQQIKLHKPRYNICLRDDKSYPYIYLSAHEYPRLAFHRGAKKLPGKFFGPYPSALAVRETLKMLQKIFPVRQCEDSFFQNRSRPCLQYQIERCTAPCVGFIDKERYAQDVENIVLFLEGKEQTLVGRLVEKMEQASAQLQFEQAAYFRDKISLVRSVLEKQYIHGERGDVDIIACATQAGVACVQVFFVRNGQHLGNKMFFPKMHGEAGEGSILQAFVAQYYLERQAPQELIVSHMPDEAELLAEVLAAQAKRQVAIVHNVRGDRARWLALALSNAENGVRGKLLDKQGLAARYADLQALLGCEELPQRLECFDISHTQGEQTVASCVVFDQDGPVKSAYRRFNIEGIEPGDDYAAIAQAVARRYKRMQQGEHPAPDVLFIDGGKGQIAAAQKALQELAINDVMIVGVSKGPDRKPGMEKLLLADTGQAVDVPPGSGGLLLVQQIRDEAHRFALTGHRQRRAKAKRESSLQGIVGLGPKRRQNLLKQLGGLQGVSVASVETLCGIEGISRQLAQRIYDTFHQQHDV